MKAAWRTGNTTALDRMTHETMAKHPGVYAALLTDRNLRWMPQIEACLAKPKPCLVVVGAAHLVGPDGLLTLMQRKGYKIEQQ